MWQRLLTTQRGAGLHEGSGDGEHDGKEEEDLARHICTGEDSRGGASDEFAGARARGAALERSLWLVGAPLRL